MLKQLTSASASSISIDSQGTTYMSAQAGVFYYDRRTVDPRLADELGHALDPFGPDGRGQHVGPGVAMVQRALWVTPEDVPQRQPLFSASGNVMTWDGRLDNRNDLLMQLWRDVGDDVSDAALAMATYDRWGVDGFRRLIGDWSLVVLDAAHDTIVLASDYMGVRPLYYSVRTDGVWWSTTLQLLVGVHRLHEDLDQQFVVGYLTSSLPPGVTPYTGVRAVPAARAVMIDRRGTRSERRFWWFDSAPVRMKTNEDYESEMRRLFVDAVRCRLRAKAAVWAQLSGGLDSSCIVCAADILVLQEQVPAPDLETICYVTDGSPETDERRFMHCVDQQRRRDSHYIQLDDSFTTVDTNWWLTPAHPTGSMLQTFRLLNSVGARVLLTGFAGDTVMGNCLDYIYDVASHLQRGRLWDGISLARRRALAAKGTVLGVLADATRELLPVRARVNRILARLIAGGVGVARTTDDAIADAFLLKPEFSRWWREEKTRQIVQWSEYPDISQRRPVSELMAVLDARQAQSPSDLPLVVTTHPYLHRPLVEFVLNIEPSVLAPPGTPRGLMRQSFAPFVPQRVISRFSKGYAPPFFGRNLRGVAAAWLKEPQHIRLTQMPCIDRMRLLRYLETVRDNTCRRLGLLNALYRMEQWMRCREADLSDRVLVSAERR